MAFDKFRKAMDELVGEIERATGENPKTGEVIGESRFDNFVLQANIRTEMKTALETIARNPDGEDQAVQMVEQIRNHLTAQQILFLRDSLRLGNYFSKKMSWLQAQRFGADLSPTIHASIEELEGYVSQPGTSINLDRAADMFWGIVERIDRAAAEYQRRAETHKKAIKEQQQRDQEAAYQRRQEQIDKLLADYASLVA